MREMPRPLLTEIRVEFLTRADEAIAASLSSSHANNTTGQSVWSAIGFDGPTPEDAHGGRVGAGNDRGSIGISLHKSGFAVGYHYATALGRVSGGTGTWTGGATVGKRTALHVGLRG